MSAASKLLLWGTGHVIGTPTSIPKSGTPLHTIMAKLFKETYSGRLKLDRLVVDRAERSEAQDGRSC